jgi:hypothetical protein
MRQWQGTALVLGWLIFFESVISSFVGVYLLSGGVVVLLFWVFQFSFRALNSLIAGLVGYIMFGLLIGFNTNWVLPSVWYVLHGLFYISVISIILYVAKKENDIS